MRTFFTFILILVIGINSYPQNTIGASQKTGTQSSGITIETPLFSIDKIYPNPTKDFITIQIKSEVSTAIQISLINILGTEIKKWDGLFLFQGNQKLKLDLSSIKTGMYFLKISTSDQVLTQVLKKN